MNPEKEKTLIDIIKIVSPGMPLRTVIDDLTRSGLGALIVFDCPELLEHNILEGGFRINSRFTPQRLFELCKMDGAIIVSGDLKRIIQANTILNPETNIHTNETGTRHRSGERTAKQAKTCVITVSERKNKTTIFFNQTKYFLKSSDELLREISSNLQVLEKQREILKEHIENLNILEVSEMVSVSDVCKVIQRSEMILKISEQVKRYFTELGRDGSIMHMRYRELLKGVEKNENEILRDYSSISLKRTKTRLENITFDGLLDLDSIARLVIEKPLEDAISPKGYRFLSHINLSEKEISNIVKEFENLNNILAADPKDFENTLKARASIINEEITNVREQILSGKSMS